MIFGKSSISYSNIIDEGNGFFHEEGFTLSINLRLMMEIFGSIVCAAVFGDIVSSSAVLIEALLCSL